MTPDERRSVDRCLMCGRFVGFYPVGFYCDRHCHDCICSDCPGVDGPGVYTARTETPLVSDDEWFGDGVYHPARTAGIA